MLSEVVFLLGFVKKCDICGNGVSSNVVLSLVNPRVCLRKSCNEPMGNILYQERKFFRDSSFLQACDHYWWIMDFQIWSRKKVKNGTLTNFLQQRKLEWASQKSRPCSTFFLIVGGSLQRIWHDNQCLLSHDHLHQPVFDEKKNISVVPQPFFSSDLNPWLQFEPSSIATNNGKKRYTKYIIKL